MKLFIVRHGETEENVAGILQGQLHGTLSSMGRVQATILAHCLRSVAVDAIYTSDLARAFDTAKAIARFHRDTALYSMKELRERHLGEFQGLLKAEIKRSIAFGEIGLDPITGESVQKVLGRARRFYDLIFKRHRHETVLVVGHNAICKALMCAIRNTSVEEYGKIGNLSNASISILQIEDKSKPVVLMFNNVDHLLGVQADAHGSDILQV